MHWQKRKGIMLCYPFDIKRLESWPKPYLVQPKLNGDRCRAIIRDNDVILLSSEENLIVGVPHINIQLKEIFKDKEIEQDGELYAHGMLHQDIHSIVSRKVNLHPNYRSIEYRIFDTVNEKLALTRLAMVKEDVPKDGDISAVPTEVCNSMKEVMEWLEVYIGCGFEGIIVRRMDASYSRKRSVNIMKFKPRKEDAYLIVGVKEELDKDGNPKNTLGSFECIDDMGTKFYVGSGPLLTTQNRKELWEYKELVINRILVIKYQNLSKNKVPIFAVATMIMDNEGKEV